MKLISTQFCLLAAVSSVIAHHPTNRNLETVQAIYNLTLYPNNMPIVTKGESAVPSGLFSANAKGRVSPGGSFSGFTDTNEYFFGLALVPQPPFYTAFSQAVISEFVSGCPQVAASVVNLVTSVVNPNATNNGQYVSTLKEVGFSHSHPFISKKHSNLRDAE